MLRTVLVVPLTLVLSGSAYCAPQSQQACGGGEARRRVRRDDSAHIFIDIQAPNDEDKAIAAVWKRILLRIPDVRLTESPVDSDLVVFLGVREIHDDSKAFTIYVWQALLTRPWAVSCGTGTKPDDYYLAELKTNFMNYASNLEIAGEMIQKSVNSIEDIFIQKIREEKRR
jgi:hypothetical protein